MATGILTGSQKKVWSFLFDCSDPSVNFTDGIYNTQLLVKKNSWIFICAIKFFQDLSSYPPININFLVGVNNIISFNTPMSNTPDVYEGNFSVYTELNPNNDFVAVQFIGMTGSGINALSFQMYFEITDFDI